MEGTKFSNDKCFSFQLGNQLGYPRLYPYVQKQEKPVRNCYSSLFPSCLISNKEFILYLSHVFVL